MSTLIDKQAALDALCKACSFKISDKKCAYKDVGACYEYNAIMKVPSAQQGLSFEKIAALLANMFGDECACNFNDIDEWLPMSCKYSETACPHPDEPHGCWLQFLLQGGADMRGAE